MTKDEIVIARRTLLAIEIDKQGLAYLGRVTKKADRQLKDMAAGRKSFGDSIAKEIGPMIRPDLPRDWLVYPELPDNVGDSRYAQAAYAQLSRIKERVVDEVVLKMFDTGGSMGGGIVLRDQPGVIQSWNVSKEWVQKNVKAHTGCQNLTIVTGFGDSMRPMFNPGDPLIVDAGVKTVEFDAVYFFRVGDEGFIKRLQRIPGEGLRAISANKEYESWTITQEMDFEVLGRVLKVWCSEDF